jgi:hypothetical protein
VILNQIKCEAVDVKTESGICPGIAKTERGETHLIGARTPGPNGICCQAFGSLSPMKLAMMYTDRMEWESREHFDITCPHGFVTFRLSRAR